MFTRTDEPSPTNYDQNLLDRRAAIFNKMYKLESTAWQIRDKMDVLRLFNEDSCYSEIIKSDIEEMKKSLEELCVEYDDLVDEAQNYLTHNKDKCVYKHLDIRDATDSIGLLTGLL